MNLNQLYYFKKLAELENFTKAASDLYISQPSLSYSISNLEKELGTSLFQKSGRNVALSNNGKEFYICIVEVLAKLEEGVAILKQNSNTSSVKINIGTIPTLSGDFIQKNIRTYLNSFPHADFDIFTCVTNKEVITGINDGVYDIGFCSKEKNEKHLHFIPMIREELVVITKTDHELAQKRILVFSDLQNYPLITYRENHPLGIFIRNLFKEQKSDPNIVFSFDEEITISEMVAQDFGIAVLVNTPLLRSHNVSVIPLKVESDLPVLYLAYHKNTICSKSINNFICLLKTNSTFACS